MQLTASGVTTQRSLASINPSSGPASISTLPWVHLDALYLLRASVLEEGLHAAAGGLAVDDEINGVKFRLRPFLLVIVKQLGRTSSTQRAKAATGI